MDWRKLEREIEEYFRVRGYRPARQLVQEAPLCGDVVVKHGNKPINLSDLARELAAGQN